MGKTEKGNLQKRIEEFDVEELEIATALRAKEILEGHDAAEVDSFSSVAAIFYKWVSPSRSFPERLEMERL